MVLVDQPAQELPATDVRGSCRCPGLTGPVRREERQRAVWTSGVVVRRVLSEDGLKMAAAEHQDMVEALLPEQQDYIVLKPKLTFAKGNIRIPLNKTRDLFFFKRQLLLKTLRKSIFAFKAATSFIYLNYI